MTIPAPAKIRLSRRARGVLCRLGRGVRLREVRHPCSSSGLRPCGGGRCGAFKNSSLLIVPSPLVSRCPKIASTGGGGGGGRRGAVLNSSSDSAPSPFLSRCLKISSGGGGWGGGGCGAALNSSFVIAPSPLASIRSKTSGGGGRRSPGGRSGRTLALPIRSLWRVLFFRRLLSVLSARGGRGEQRGQSQR